MRRTSEHAPLSLCQTPEKRDRHLHFIRATPFRNANWNTLVSNGKRFIAYEIVERLKNSKHNHLLKQLEKKLRVLTKNAANFTGFSNLPLMQGVFLLKKYFFNR